jgi:hypothetical protein
MQGWRDAAQLILQILRCIIGIIFPVSECTAPPLKARRRPTNIVHPAAPIVISTILIQNE